MLNKLRNDLVFIRQLQHGLFFLFVLMSVSLFSSRILLSISSIVFVFLSFFYDGLRKQFTNFFSTPLLWGISLLFLVPLISGLWSADKEQWLDIVRIKLPLVFLPLAFAAGFKFPKPQWEWGGYIFIFLVTAGSIWSIFNYISNFEQINEAYLQAKIMLTPLQNDHVRFSWLVSIAILLCGYFFYNKMNTRVSWLFFITGVLLIVFLHLLAARTGLISFYLIVLATIGWIVIKTRQWKIALIISCLIILMPVLAYEFIPSFKNKVKYFLYDKGFFEKANYLKGGTDAIRVISWKAGWALMNQQPMNGYGFGDVRHETNQYYSHHYSQMDEADKVYPCNEWLIYGAGAGWPGFLVFSFVMAIPFFTRVKQKLLWWLLNATAALSFMVDIGLEVQFGVFIYTILVLWWWKWFND